MRGAAGRSPEAEFVEGAARLARDQVARRANETVIHNVGRDRARGARFARVPMGAEPCAFCTMLASRGFVYHTEETAGELDHFHSSCRCKVVPGFPEMEFYYRNGVKVSRGRDPSVEGYDPDRYYDMWKHPDKYVKGGGAVEALKVPPFSPSKTVEEAQEYARRFIADSGYSPTFKLEANYKGLSVESANQVNEGLYEAFSKADIPKVNGIKVISAKSAAGKRVFKDSDAAAAYNFAERGIYLNKDLLKTPEAFAKHAREADDAFKFVVEHKGELSGKRLETARRYERSGRSLVDGGSISGAVIHEVGHHVDWTVFGSGGNAIRSDMRKYADGISGYAGSSNREYMAESFAAYCRGETENLDPRYVNVINAGGGEGKKSSSAGGIAYRKAGPRKYDVRLPKNEYAAVMSAINTNYHARFDGLDHGIIAVGDYIYRFRINEFGDYSITGKWGIDE